MNLRIPLRDLPLQSDLTFIQVPTLEIYLITTHLGGGATFSYDGMVKNVYAETVTSDSAFQEWSVRLKADLRFSNGEPLDATHFYFSLVRAIRNGLGVHFNPRRDFVGGEGSLDGQCEGLTIVDNRTIKIKLKNGNRMFPALLGKIEAAILFCQSIDDPCLEQITTITSGPYFLDSISEEEISLIKNPFYTGGLGCDSPDHITFIKEDDLQAVAGLVSGQNDFIIPRSPLSSLSLLQLKKVGVPLNWFGQTVFLAPRASSDEQKNPWISNLDFRLNLSKIVQSIEPPDQYFQTSQIWIGEGLGRIVDEVPSPHFKKYEASVPPGISLAAIQNDVTAYIVAELEKRGLSVKPVWVKTFTELYQLPEALRCDFIVGWSDFCGRDPYIGYYNALNPDRPLFYDNQQVFRKMLIEIGQMESTNQKDAAYRDLHIKLLNSGCVIPFVARWGDLFAHSRIDLSQAVPFAFWTAKSRPSTATEM